MLPDPDLDSMAVVGHVADIVHAFKEGVNYLKRIRERRRTRPPSRPGLVLDTKSMQDLEFSLARGQDVVRSHYERDYRRLGQVYARGDNEAASQLKSILSELQSIVVVNLKSAYQHDEDVNFLMLQDVSDESQDRANMVLMQLHQRVLASGDLEEIATGNPYVGARHGTSRTRNPPRTIPEEPRVTMRSGHGVNSNATSQDFRPSRQHLYNPPTPDLSPFQEHPSPVQQSSQRSPFRRPKPPVLPLDDQQPTMPTLPTPPADKTLSPPPGPPPTAPLPPAPVNWHRQKRREELKSLKIEAERRAQKQRAHTESGRSFLDRTFAEVQETWEDPWQQEPSPVKKYEFQEPHPGVEVDPSRVDEPQPDYAPLSPPIISPTQYGTLQRPRTSPRTNPTPAKYRLIPPQFVSRNSTATSPERSDAGESLSPRHDRLSMTSTATYSSHASGSSIVSALSRATTASSSSSSFRETPPVPQMPALNLVTRSRSIARVPEPIYESSMPAESQSTLRPADIRRPSAPEFAHSSDPALSINSVPPIPPMPVDAPRILDARRESAYSQQSASSSGSGLPPPVPVRVIPAQVTDASNSKMYMPTEANKFGGLCKGAWRAQIGDFKKAYQAQQRPGGVATNRMVDFMRCKTCDFQGKVVIDAKGKKIPDRKMIVAKDTGVTYRWDFLFKSHLVMKSGSSADAEYGCMFCVAEGKGTLVFKGMNAFIAHTAEHRPGVAGNNNDCQVPDTTVCDRMEAVTGRGLSADERYEIALPVAEPSAIVTIHDGMLSPLSPPGISSPDVRAVSRGSSRY